MGRRWLPTNDTKTASDMHKVPNLPHIGITVTSQGGKLPFGTLFCALHLRRTAGAEDDWKRKPACTPFVLYYIWCNIEGTKKGRKCAGCWELVFGGTAGCVYLA
ncbi:MAG: hypothetical protein KatS3mg109_1053 [Pirellulaceae bacterium]|nr:MAG: hypothetical protein KatS3mg109_1053 [Pirellulaceae bacterium]